MKHERIPIMTKEDKKFFANKEKKDEDNKLEKAIKDRIEADRIERVQEDRIEAVGEIKEDVPIMQKMSKELSDGWAETGPQVLDLSKDLEEKKEVINDAGKAVDDLGDAIEFTKQFSEEKLKDKEYKDAIEKKEEEYRQKQLETLRKEKGSKIKDTLVVKEEEEKKEVPKTFLDNKIQKEKARKRKKEDVIVFADIQDKISGVSEDFARTETSNVKGQGIRGFFKNFFGNRLGYDVRYRRKASLKEKEIYETGKISNKGDEDIAVHGDSIESAEEKEKNAIIERLTQGFYLPGNGKAKAETLKDFGNEASEKIKEALKEYAVEDIIDEDEFKNKIFSVITDVFSEDKKENEKKVKAFNLTWEEVIETRYVSNIFKLANEIKSSKKDNTEKESRINLIKLKKAVALGGQLTTEKLNKVEGFVDNICKKVPLASALNYTAVAVAAVAAGTIKSGVGAALGVGGAILYGSAVSGIREGRKMEKDRAQIARESAVGYEQERFDEKQEALGKLGIKVEKALTEEKTIDSIKERIKKLPNILVEKKDSFVDLYIKLIDFNKNNSKEAYDIIKDIKHDVKKYYNNETPADTLKDREKEYKEYKDLVSQVGDINNQSRQRENMKQFIYKQKHVQELINGMYVHEKMQPAKIKTSFDNLIEAIARRDMSANYRIDLLEYSSKGEIERERLLLDISIAKYKNTIRKIYKKFTEEQKQEMFGEFDYKRLEDTNDFDNIFTKFLNKKVKELTEYKEAVDETFHKNKTKESIKRAAITAAVSVAGIFVAQEIKALASDRLYGVVERMFDKGKGASDASRHTMLDSAFSAVSSLNKKPETGEILASSGGVNNFYQSIQHLIRGGEVGVENIATRNPFHMDNGTTIFDKNELKLDIGKSGNNVVASMQRMLSGDSFRGAGSSINPLDKTNNIFKLLLSPNDGSKNHPISILFGPDGVIHIPKGLEHLFDASGKYIGKYAEVAAFDRASGKMVGILATVVGEGVAEQALTSTVITAAASGVAASGTELGGMFIPTSRKPLEKAAKKNEQEFIQPERPAKPKKSNSVTKRKTKKDVVIEPVSKVEEQNKKVETETVIEDGGRKKEEDKIDVMYSNENMEPELNGSIPFSDMPDIWEEEENIDNKEVVKEEEDNEIVEQVVREEVVEAPTETATPIIEEKSEDVIIPPTEEMVESVESEKEKVIDAVIENVNKPINKDEEEKIKRKFETLEAFRTFRIVTFLIKQYATKEQQEYILSIKNKRQRRFETRRLLANVWHEIVMHKGSPGYDLDEHGVLFLLKLAGFNINNVIPVEKGNALLDKFNIDTGNLDGIGYQKDIEKTGNKKNIKYEETFGDKTTETIKEYDETMGMYRGANADHHGEFSGRDSSATKYLLKILNIIGFEDKNGKYRNLENNNYLNAIVDFVTREDNKDYNYTLEKYSTSFNNLFSYKKLLKDNHLFRLYNNKDIMDKWEKYSKENPGATIEFMELTDDELISLGLFDTELIKNGKKKEIHNRNEEEKKKALEEERKVIESHIKHNIEIIEGIEKNKINISQTKFGKCIVVNSDNIADKDKSINLVDTAIAKGYGVVIKFSPKNNSFSVSFLGKEMPKFSDKFLITAQKYGVIRVRNMLQKSANIGDGIKPMKVEDKLIDALIKELNK